MVESKRESVTYINNPSSKILEKIKKITESHKSKTTEVISKAHNASSQKINIKKIYDRIYIMDPIKNDSLKVCDFLVNIISSKYLVVSLRNLNKLFKYFIYINNLSYDCEKLLEICNALKAWYITNKFEVMVIEIDTNIPDLIILFVECLIICITKKETNLNFFCNYKDLICKSDLSNLIIRYKKYFYKLMINTTSLNILKLHQVIISNYPKIPNLNKFKVKLEIYKGKTRMFNVSETDELQIIYKDNFYIVVTNINLDISGDLILQIYFNNVEIFKLPFNSFYYEQGLFRYKKDDLITNLNDIFTEDFKIDLIFLDTNKVKKLHKSQNDMLDGLEHFNKLYNKKENSYLFDKLINMGYNKIVAKYCAKMDFTDQEILNFINEMEAMGIKDLFVILPLKFTTLKFKEKHVASNDQIKIRSNITEDREKLFKNIKCEDIKLIEIIKDKVYNKIKNTKNKTKVHFKKKDYTPELYQKVKYKAIRPLHVVPITSIENTIFKSLPYKLNLDIEKFIKYFCIENTEENLNTIIQKNINSAIDSKRLFLVSLALKHLNKKNITPDNVYTKLKTDLKNIYIQDLLNLETVFPTYEEAYILATSEFVNLSTEEKLMLEYSKLIEVSKLTKLFIFERLFFDEIFLIEEILEKIKITLFKLENSKEIKIILKSLVEISNLINCEYSTKKNLVEGFKLSGIFLFFNYKGRFNYTLSNYIKENLNIENMTENLNRDFKYLDIVRKEQLSKLKDKINFLILKYSDNLEIYYSLENDKELVKRLLVFVCEKLGIIKNLYEECTLQASRIKTYFDEDEKKNITEIFDCISFLIEKVTEKEV